MGKKKLKFWKSKGGWIGLVIFVIIPILFLSQLISQGLYSNKATDGSPTGATIFSCPGTAGIVEHSNCGLDYLFFMNILIFAIIGFIIGYFIEKKFFRR